jgi:hypothetical protein
MKTNNINDKVYQPAWSQRKKGAKKNKKQKTSTTITKTTFFIPV